MLTEGPAAEAFDAHVYLDYGTLEEDFIRDAANDLRTVLEEHGIPHEVVEYEGGHSLSSSRFTSVLVPYFAKQLEP